MAQADRRHPAEHGLVLAHRAASVKSNVSSCPACGTDNAPDARFCSRCGTSLVTRVGVEERRRVTALFADLAGSTGMGERLDPEVMRGLVGRFFELATLGVQRHGGTAEKFAGDSVLALFGLAVSHEDDAERAVRCALAIRSAVEPLAADAQERHGVSVAVRIGIESGEVVVGDPFGGATMATGDVLNVAARLQQLAEPAEILVGAQARHASRDAVRYEPLGERPVRGRDEPVEVWRAIEAVAELGGERGVPGLSAPLVGRDAELELLLGAHRRTVHERKSILFTLVGVPGIGKSRLVREAVARMEAGGARIVRGRSLPYGEGITYWAMAEIVRDLAGIGPEVAVAGAMARLERVAPEPEVAERLALAIGLTTERPGVVAAAEREIAWAFRRLIESIAATQPLVIVFEDVHWAEPPMLEVIEHLAAWARGVPILVLCTGRPELIDRRPGWGSGRMESSRVHLEPLDRSHSTALLSSLLAIDDLPDALRDRVVERAEGNPLFVEEVVRMLIDQGAVVQRDDRWVATGEAHHVAVPETVEAIIRARLDTLPRPERALLQVASVVGRVFERSAVAVLVDDDHPLQLLLEEAVLRDLVNEEVEPEPSYRFKHILIRDVAYASLPKARRADLHARVAAWLLDRGAGRADEVADIRAYHLEQAVHLQAELDGRVDEGRRQEAVEALTASADRALGREDHLAAESFATRALDLPGATGPPSLELRWRLVEAVRGRRDIVRTGKLADDLAADARAAGRPDIEGRALYAGIEAIWVGMGVAQGTELVRMRLDRSVELLTAAGDLRHLFEAEYWSGFIGWWHGDLAAASERWERAEGIARQLGDPGREGLAVSRQAAAARNRGDVDRALELNERSVALAAQGGSRYAQAHAAIGYANMLALVSSVPLALARVDQALRLYEELGDREGIGEAHWAMGSYANLTGEPEKAVAPLRRAVALYEEIGHVGFLPEVERELAEALLDLGDVDEAEAHALRAREVVGEDDWSTVASTKMVLGLVRAAQGRDDEAETLLREAVAITARTDYLPTQCETAARLAVFLLSRGRDEGRTWVDTARSIAERFGPRSPILTAIERGLAPFR